jgi:phenazine biosynthesis-like protein
VFTNAVGLAESEMQSIAREMAFSETTFLFPAESRDVTTRVRINPSFRCSCSQSNAAPMQRCSAECSRRCSGYRRTRQRVGRAGHWARISFVTGAVTQPEATHMISLQGVSMGRQSRIAIALTCENGEITDLCVGGTCVSVGAGSLNVSEQPSEHTR